MEHLNVVNIVMSFVLGFTFYVLPMETHTKHLTTISQQELKLNIKSNKTELHTEKTQKYITKKLKYFSINYVPQLNNSLHQQIEATLTRQDVQQRVDAYGNTYGNLFSTRPELSKHILKVSEQFSINPYFLTAIIMQESGNGTSNMLYSRNNTSGMRCISDKAINEVKKVDVDFGEVTCVSVGQTGNFAVFNSIEDSITFTGWTLRNNYFNKGLVNIEDVSEVYAPHDDEQDINNLNQSWVDNIKFRLKQFSANS